MEKVENDKFAFDEAELADFKRFWEGDIGKKYIEKMKYLKDQMIDRAMGSYDRDGAAFFAHIANGVDTVINDIDRVINANSENKEAKAKKSTK